MSETKFNKGVWSTSPKKNAVISTCSGGLEIQGATGEWAVAYYGGNLICESVSEDNANVIAMSTICTECWITYRTAYAPVMILTNLWLCRLMNCYLKLGVNRETNQAPAILTSCTLARNGQICTA